jgi:GxxExxY protein
MIYELRERGIKVESEQSIPIRYKTLVLDGRYRIDLIVEDTISQSITRRFSHTCDTRTSLLAF